VTVTGPGGGATIRDLASLADCRRVAALEAEVWGDEMEIVPSGLLVVSAKRGGILLGAFDGDEMVGFVWSMPGRRDGRPMQWSHMLAVRPVARGRLLGVALKWAQRERALAQGIDLVEWTFDPLMARNAHLNFAWLGTVASTYLPDAYGALSGPLHRGTPTDRLIGEWWIRSREVVERASAPAAAPAPAADEAPDVIATAERGGWIAPADVRTDLEEPRIWLTVPPRFGAMQAEATDLAVAWRMAVREAFQAYFGRGYRVTAFRYDRDTEGGRYLLEPQP
jgi:predicted GNAT superfamily acetyltransferase